jgi:hypothetical protein
VRRELHRPASNACDGPERSTISARTCCPARWAGPARVIARDFRDIDNKQTPWCRDVGTMMKATWNGWTSASWPMPAALHHSAKGCGRY